MFLAVAGCIALPLASTGHASTQPAPLGGSIRPVIEQFLLEQSAGLPGKVSVTVHTPLSGNLPPCDRTVEPFLMKGARPWGRLSVGVRCSGSQPWTRYVPAHIGVTAAYYVAARAIVAGETVSLNDLAMREGDLTVLPPSVLTNSTPFVGAVAAHNIAAGAPLRRELFRQPTAVQSGQNVKVVIQGAGFVLRSEAKALTSGAVGTAIQVKTQNGQLVSGIVREDATVEVSN